jgi:ectoine hydroxylase-related dioxygenase (phytanoyl-CoA dioxygenase family)
MSIANTDRQRLEEDGYLVLPELIRPSQIASMKSRLEELLAITPQTHAGTLIVGGLLSEPIFDTVWNHPRILGAVESVLGRDYFLAGVFSRGLRPGHGQQALHTDWAGQGEKGVWYQCHAICAIGDFTPQNGATRVLPKSHRNPWMVKGIQDLRRRHPSEVQLVGKAGTVFIVNVHCFHSAVQNSSPHPRLALFSSFSRRDSPLLIHMPHVKPEQSVLERFAMDERRLLTCEIQN